MSFRTEGTPPPFSSSQESTRSSVEIKHGKTAGGKVITWFKAIHHGAKATAYELFLGEETKRPGSDPKAVWWLGRTLGAIPYVALPYLVGRGVHYVYQEGKQKFAASRGGTNKESPTTAARMSTASRDSHMISSSTSPELSDLHLDEEEASTGSASIESIETSHRLSFSGPQEVSAPSYSSHTIEQLKVRLQQANEVLNQCGPNERGKVKRRPKLGSDGQLKTTRFDKMPSTASAPRSTKNAIRQIRDIINEAAEVGITSIKVKGQDVAVYDLYKDLQGLPDFNPKKVTPLSPKAQFALDQAEIASKLTAMHGSLLAPSQELSQEELFTHLETLEAAIRLGVTEVGSASGLIETKMLLADLRTRPADFGDQTFQTRLMLASTSLEALPVEQAKSMGIPLQATQQQLVEGILTGSNASLHSLLAHTYRNNSLMSSLFEDLRTAIASDSDPRSRNEKLDNACRFALVFVRDGGMPVRGGARESVRQELLQLATLAPSPEAAGTSSRPMTSAEQLIQALGSEPPSPPSIDTGTIQACERRCDELSRSLSSDRREPGLFLRVQTELQEVDRLLAALPQGQEGNLAGQPLVLARNTLKEAASQKIGGLPCLPLDVENASAHELSNVLCHALELAFSEIQPSELDVWTKSAAEKAEQAPHIKAYIDQFNLASSYVKHSILHASNPQEQAKKCIEAADLAFSRHNYAAGFAIMGALGDSSINRLNESIWRTLPNKHQRMFERMKLLCAPAGNFGALRKNASVALEKDQRVVPHLGLFLQDMTFITEGNSETVKDAEGMISLKRNVLIQDVKMQLKAYQESLTKGAGPAPSLLYQDSAAAMTLHPTIISDATLYALSQERESRKGEVNREWSR